MALMFCPINTLGLPRLTRAQLSRFLSWTVTPRRHSAHLTILEQRPLSLIAFLESCVEGERRAKFGLFIEGLHRMGLYLLEGLHLHGRLHLLEGLNSLEQLHLHVGLHLIERLHLSLNVLIYSKGVTSSEKLISPKIFLSLKNNIFLNDFISLKVIFSLENLLERLYLLEGLYLWK